MPFAAWALVRLGPVESYRTTQLLAFTPYAALGSLFAVALSLALRRRLAGVVAVVALVILSLSVLPRAFGGQAADAGEGSPLTVMTLNMSDGEASPREIVDLVKERDVDVLSLQEISSEGRPNLRRSGLGETLPRRAPGGDGSVLYMPATGRALATPPALPADAVIPGVEIAQGGAEIQVWAPHPPSPTDSSKYEQWQAVLADIPPAPETGPLRVIAGDLNSTLDHPELRDVLDTGYVDAADAVGSGLATTYPSSGLVPPPITIDHVLVDSRVEVSEVWVEDVSGTDHRAVIAELLIPR